MKNFLFLILLITLTSCASTLTRHRMQAAQRKLIETRRLQQAGQWDDAFVMAERMHSSIEKSVAGGALRSASSGAKIDLLPLYTAWNIGPYTELRNALKWHDARAASTAFVALRQQCVNCHTVLGRNDIQMAAW